MYNRFTPVQSLYTYNSMSLHVVRVVLPYVQMSPGTVLQCYRYRISAVRSVKHAEIIPSGTRLSYGPLPVLPAADWGEVTLLCSFVAVTQTPAITVQNS